MGTSKQLADDIRHALERVLYLQSEQTLVEDDVLMPSDERWVAAIAFSGDRQGYALMALTDRGSNAAVSYILQRLGLQDMYVPPVTVYPEILNMLAGHLITRLEAEGLVYTVGTPIDALTFSPYEQPASRAVHIKTDKDFCVGFYFYVKESLA